MLIYHWFFIKYLIIDYLIIGWYMCVNINTGFVLLVL